ncbi:MULTISPECIES: GntR family transcriptional regulator [Clostridium]|uniref:GntR family transcriptional regulator n=1 Tax=Clostridium TaxID=1485 RepID=UPI0018975D03|nr:MULTISPECIES: GntR family transcriptional regulator [Clostridium]MCR1949942.1 GntR family transcriptional regulator [Clostridium sp. DSM 100503]MDI9215692.1 GntR family transcriptional regulator [Clostridium tertium]
MDKKIKYIEIFEFYKDKISSGEIKENEKLPTEQEIGQIFSVSRHTVRQSIVELEKEGYIYREKSKGAYAKKLDKLKKTHSKLVIVITTYISEYIFPYLIKGIQEALNENGYDILLLNTNNEKAKEREQLKKLLEYDVAGAIIEPTASALGNTNEDYYAEIDKNNIPYLMINATYDKENQSYVIMDDKKGTYTLCDYLINLGHKKIAGIFKEDDIQGLERKKGYLKALEKNKIEIDSTIIGNFKTYEEDFYVYAFAKNLLSRGDRPTAVVCYNDKTAIKVIKVAKELGLKIPEDLSIVGYDNDETISEILDYGITTINHPKEKMGKKAAEILVSLINKEKDKANYIYDPEIVKKDSVRKI